ncbi:MAG: MarR family winged helix-turn-helix transcriptional regulator [Bacillota bacterium]
MVDKEAIIENLLTFLPILYKRIFKGMAECDITRQQMELLYYLKHEGGKPMNYYGSKMLISKPNLSVLADKLIEEGFVERGYLPDDRRVIILKITGKGEKFLQEQMNRIKKHLLEKMSAFGDEDIKRLNELMEESRAIILKLEDNG